MTEARLVRLMGDDDEVRFSTNAQVLHILKNATEPMDAHAIYLAGAFDYEQQLYNALGQMAKKGAVLRNKPGNVWLYTIGEVPDYLKAELAALAQSGLPEPDPGRRVGLSRDEYTTLSKDEKRELRLKRSVTHTTTISEEHSVVESIPSFIPVSPDTPVGGGPVVTIDPTATLTVPAQLAPPEPQAPPPPAPEPPSQPAVTVETPAFADTGGAHLSNLLAKRDEISAEIAAIRVLRAIVRQQEHIGFVLGDWAEMLHNTGVAKEFDVEMGDAIREAEELHALLGEKNNLAHILARAARHLRDYGDIIADGAVGDATAEGDEARADAVECTRLANILDVQ